jgi:hypothetical protein
LALSLITAHPAPQDTANELQLQMTQEQLDLIIQLIDAKIAMFGARKSSDGGLIESIRVSDLVEELQALLSRKN